jgi:hypothetical protein
LIIIDNNSTYEPLLDYYKEIQEKYIVHYCDSNYGHTVVWDQGLSKLYGGDNEYVVTDSDILTDHCKSDYLEVLEEGLSKYPQYKKVGLGLNTNNIPNGFKRRDEVIRHENKYIDRKEIGDNVFYECPVDTTFALYRSGNHEYHIFDSLRTKKPYEATHLGWHITELTEEDKYYFESIKQTNTGHWRL